VTDPSVDAATPAISVVIPTLNRDGRLLGTLESLTAQTIGRDRFEVIPVLDAATTSGTDVSVDSFAADHPDLRLRAVRSAGSGINAARNAGIREAAGSVVVFLDDDEVAPGDHLERAWRLLEAHPDVPGVGGPARARDADGLPTCPRCAIGEATVAVDASGLSDRLLGGNMAVRRPVFDEVGLFDERLSGRGDEVEWFARQARKDFLYEDELYIWHRRDGFTARELCRTAFRHGRALPLFRLQTGDAGHASVARVARFVAHGVTKRCVNGFVLAARETGDLLAGWRLAVTRWRTS